MQREIIKYPHPFLSRTVQPVQKMPDGTWSPNVIGIVADMFETMNAAGGVGLSASQIEVDSRIIVINLSKVERSSYLQTDDEFYEGPSNRLPERRGSHLQPGGEKLVRTFCVP